MPKSVHGEQGAKGYPQRPPTVLVTGSSRGLGRGAALELAKAGWSVAIHYSKDLAAAQDTAARCREAAPSPEQRFETFRCDLASAAERKALVEAVGAAYGELDALVNNAGMGPRVRADILDATEESFEELMAANLQGPYFLTQAFARRWLASDAPPSVLPHGRKIIFVTSISADTVSTGRGEYCVSKAGLSMASRLWAVRLAPCGIQVYEIRPGIMATDMTSGVKAKYDAFLAQGIVPQNRWGRPKDLGLAVCALLEGKFPFSTGTVIDLDGGFHLSRL
ncbi:MAG: 3-ketoacyl-ACP reductase [Spirochaetes bacterium]|nr:3-ketoacyl-ACP reductase [Spirochaetota bacterium]